MKVTFDIPDVIVPELNQIAKDNGFVNAKAMTIEYWKATVKASRSSKALAGIKEAAEAKADTDTLSIS